MQSKVDSYLSAMTSIWAPSTMRSERARMRRLTPLLHLPPEELWAELKRRYSPYAAQTAYTRVVRFYDWLNADAPNPYKKYRAAYPSAFRNLYQRSQPRLSFDEALARVEKISDKDSREKARELLTTGLRVSEYEKVEKSEVVGKGGKRRRVFGNVSKRRPKARVFRTELKRVGLGTPHDLRKLFAQRLVEKGVGVFDLMEVMGWSNLNTAQSYVTASRDLGNIIKEALDEKV